MDERRTETRLLCAELVEIVWRDKVGSPRRRIANLEDISECGACLQAELPIEPGTEVALHYGTGMLTGTVRYCTYRDFGYFVGVKFQEDSKWSTKYFRPGHLLDPASLLLTAGKRPHPGTHDTR